MKAGSLWCASLARACVCAAPWLLHEMNPVHKSKIETHLQICSACITFRSIKPLSIRVFMGDFTFYGLKEVLADK